MTILLRLVRNYRIACILIAPLKNALSLALAITCALFSLAHSDTLETGMEYKLKAAFVYNFLQFVEFDRKPDTEFGDTLRVCVVSNNDFPEGFDELSSKQVLGKRIEIVRLTSRQEFNQCSVLFYVAPVEPDISKSLDKAARSGILTVGESDSFVGSGGMIHFLIKANKLRFRVDLAKVREARITISSRILKLAEEILQ